MIIQEKILNMVLVDKTNIHSRELHLMVCAKNAGVN